MRARERSRWQEGGEESSRSKRGRGGDAVIGGGAAGKDDQRGDARGAV